MPTRDHLILAARTRLRPWRDSDQRAFAALVLDAEVMADRAGR